MTKLALYSRHFHNVHKRGIGVYSHQLVHAIARLITQTDIVLWDFSLRDEHYRHFPQPQGANFKISAWRIPGRIGDFILPRLPLITPIIQLQGIKLVHFLHEFRVPKTNTKRIIMTVHDLGPVLYPSFYENAYRSEWISALDRGIEQSCRVLTVSDSVRKQLEEYRPKFAAKYSTTPLGVESFFFNDASPGSDQRELESCGIYFPYVLYTGAADPNKNLVRTLEAFSLFLEISGCSTPHRLVIVGDTNWGGYSACREMIRKLGIEKRVHFTGYLAHERLPIYYRNCDLFLFPSSFEGFGLPLLEAMASGAACLTSNRPAMNEIGADAVAYCDPDAAESIAGKLFELLDNPTVLTQLGVAGKKRAKTYSWIRTARETVDVYEQVLGRKLI
jgi:glycosyltransferase involved in cell wall biosynthesis